MRRSSSSASRCGTAGSGASSALTAPPPRRRRAPACRRGDLRRPVAGHEHGDEAGVRARRDRAHDRRVEQPAVARRDPARLDRDPLRAEDDEREARRRAPCVRLERAARLAARARREVEPEVVDVLAVAAQAVLDHPVLAAHERDPALVHRLVDGAPRLAGEHVESRLLAPPQQPAVGDRPAGPAARVGRLVEPVDADRVVRRGAAEPAPQVRRRLRVAPATGVHDQRPPAAVGLEREQVVVAVAAVAERAAVEDQEPGVRRPSRCAERSSRRRGSSR